MTADAHNEFIRRAFVLTARELLAQGDMAAQLVALESLTAGYLALIMREAGKSAYAADGFISALSHGLRGRVKKLL